jgi:hypothetical protein
MNKTQVLRPSQIVDAVAPHYTTAIIGAAVAAAAAAASAAQQAAAQAKARRAAAQSAQQAKQGEQGGAGPASSVAEGMLGGLNQGLSNPRIQDLIQGAVKPSAGAADKSIAQPQPTQPLGGAPPAAQQGPTMQDGSFQSSLGGQQPDYMKWLQMQQNMGGTGFTG